MKTLIKYIFISIIALVAVSCELPDNIDPKSASSVTPDALFTDVEIQLFNQISSVNVNRNVFRLIAQYQTEVTYVTESNYNFSDRSLPDAHWSILYRDVLANAEESKRIINETNFTDQQEKANKLAYLEILEVYTYHLLVDAFGNVPYTEALKGADNSRPKYDDAKTIYYDIINRLNSAINTLKADQGSATFGDADILYGGDNQLWIEFANSLKLRLALRLADYDSSKSATMISEAVSSGVFSNQNNSAILHYTGVTPYVNSYYTEYVLNLRKDYVPSNTIIDKMNSLNDPRRSAWFTTIDGEYKGLRYGNAGSYKSYSHFVDGILKDPKYPAVILDYVEVEFLLAEAAARNLGGVTNAESHYNKAVKESMLYWGISEADADVYLAQPSVAYSTASSNWKETIGTQKWLGLFDRGIEGWNEWRMLDYPTLNPPEDMVYSDIPVRFPYPYNENKLNGDNYHQAAQAIGGDLVTTKIFWDKH